MSFWDAPEHQPRGGSWPAEGTITRLAVMDSPRYAGKVSLVVELDSDGRQRWCPIRLWRALAESRAEIGDRIRVTRGPDDPPAQPGGHPIPTWVVERLQGPVKAQGWGTQSAGPTW